MGERGGGWVGPVADAGLDVAGRAGAATPAGRPSLPDTRTHCTRTPNGPRRCSAHCRTRSPPTASPTPRPNLAPDDRSVAVHACHGRARQVEVLREVVLDRLAADPTLEPRDVLVMCPDVEEFAPLIAAAFGLHASAATATVESREQHPAARLRVRLADRALTQGNPLLGTMASLLELLHRPPDRGRRARPRGQCARSGAGSVSTTTRSSGCTPGWAARASAGAWTASTATATNSARSDRAPGGTGWTGCCSASRWRRTPTCWAPPCRSTTSTPPTSTWPAGSRSSSTGSTCRSRALGRTQSLRAWTDALRGAMLSIGSAGRRPGVAGRGGGRPSWPSSRSRRPARTRTWS